MCILTTGVSPIKEVMFSWITAFGARETLDVRLMVVFTARGRVEMSWVNDNMVDVIDRLNRIVALFGPTVFSKIERKNVNERRQCQCEEGTRRLTCDGGINQQARIVYSFSTHLALTTRAKIL